MLLVALLAGCPPAQEGNLLFDERFENEAQFRADWAITGDVAFVTTYHPAEHALVAHGVATLTGPLSFYIYGASSDGEWLEYSTPCPGEPEVWSEPGNGGLVIHASIPVGAPVAWRRVHASFPPITIDPSGTYIGGLTLELDDPDAACPIDNLRVYEPTW
jgi:hypothetical protein